MATLKKTSVYLDEEIDQALAALAAQEGLTKAEFIRRQLRAAVARPSRPRISIGVFNVGAPAWADDLDDELRTYLDREERASRTEHAGRDAA